MFVRALLFNSKEVILIIVTHAASYSNVKPRCRMEIIKRHRHYRVDYVSMPIDLKDNAVVGQYAYVQFDAAEELYTRTRTTHDIS